jgi:hypothetical protein
MIIKARDLYTLFVKNPLKINDPVIEQTMIQYEARRYTDTRNLTKIYSFIITCTQRIIIPNSDPFPMVVQSVTGFSQYPALFTNEVKLVDTNSILQDISLVDYAPKTINTAVTGTQNNSDSSNTTVSQQYSTGSILSQTNSYGLSMTESLIPGISRTMSSSSTDETSSASTQGSAVDSGAQYSNASSMSMKDWGSYVQFDSAGHTPTWIWGQEYPWDLIQFRNVENDYVVLPQYVVDRLYDGTQVYPPSELSLFGVDFVSKVAWLVTPKSGLASSQSISFTHTLTYCTATHKLLDGALAASIDFQSPVSGTAASLDLPVLALDPVGVDNGPALIGFVPNQFDAAPSSGGDFAITAESNLMLVRGSGFPSVMTTDFANGAVEMTLYFKLLESSKDINLSLKHWVNSGGACEIAIVVNGTTNLTRYITAPEAGSGGDNVTVIPLRCKDFTSVDYCDFLQFGLNTVVITVTSTSTPSASYTLMAMAVG